MKKILPAMLLLIIAMTSCDNSDDKSDKNIVPVTPPGAQWARSTTTGVHQSFFRSVAVDSSGNIYAAGTIEGTDSFNFGNSVTATGAFSDGNLILVKYNSAGEAQWARTVTGSDESKFYSVAVDSNDNIYAAGYIYGTLTFGFGSSVTAAGVDTYDNILLVKYNSSGTAQWAKTVTATCAGYSGFESVTVDSSGNIYAAGYIGIAGIYNFGDSVTATNPWDWDSILLVKYNSAGTAQWARTINSDTNSSNFMAVHTDSSGNVYAAGYIWSTGTFVFDTGIEAIGINSGDNALLVKYNSAGVAQWAKTTITAPNDSGFNSVDIDSSGNIYAAGYIYGTTEFGFGNSVTATGISVDDNALLIKYNSDGTPQWAEATTSGSGYSGFNSVSIDSSDNIYTAGYIGGSGEFGFGNSVTATGAFSDDDNILFVVYNTDGTPQSAYTTTSGSAGSYYNSVAADNSGNIYAAGSIYGTAEFGFGNSVTVTGTYSEYDVVNGEYGDNILLVKYVNN